MRDDQRVAGHMPRTAGSTTMARQVCTNASESHERQGALDDPEHGQAANRFEVHFLCHLTRRLGLNLP